MKSIWTDKEITLLKEHYPNTPVKILQEKYLPNRTISEIYRKALKLNIKRDSQLKWTDKEITLLKEHYPNTDVNTLIENYFPNRTKSAIHKKVNRLGLLKCEFKRQDENIKSYILENYGKKTLEEIADNLGISINYLTNIIKDLKMSNKSRTVRGRTYRLWTPEEDKILKENFKSMNCRELQERFLPHRTKTAIRTRLSGLRLIYKDPIQRFTKEEIDTIIKYYNKFTLKEMHAKYFSYRDKSTLEKKVNKLVNDDILERKYNKSTRNRKER